MPSEGELYEQIAARMTSADADKVRETLSAHGIELTSPLPARRQLVVHRLYCEGIKSATDDNDGAFTRDMTLWRRNARPWTRDANRGPQLKSVEPVSRLLTAAG
ncbi:hypothetical protein [Streptomyces sp. NPDC003032]